VLGMWVGGVGASGGGQLPHPVAGTHPVEGDNVRQ
jgi:hypothetical protein